MKLALTILLASTICSHAYTIDDYCRAIRKAEGDRFYGIRSVKVASEADAYAKCWQTVYWFARGYHGTNFIEDLGKKYCPLNDPKDVLHKNRHWARNVRWFLKHPDARRQTAAKETK